MAAKAWAAILGAVAGLCGTGGAAAYGQSGAEPSELEALRAELRALRERVEQLEMRPPSEAEIAATRAKIAADVASKQPVLRYDPKDGLYLGTPDEAYSIRPKFALQMRYVANHDDSRDKTDDGFELRRIKFYASGTVFTKDLTYYIDVGISPSTGTMTLVDAFMTYKFAPLWYIRGGQFKNPYAREFYATDLRIFAVDWSLVSELIGGHNAGRTKGLQLIYGNNTKDSPWTAHLTLTDGDKQLNTAYDSTVNSNFGAAARLEYKFFGDWASYPDQSHIDSPDDLLVLGGGVSYSQGDLTKYRSTVDVQYEFLERGTLFSAVFLNHTTDSDAPSATDGGFNVQLGWLLTRQFEPYVRYNISVFEFDQANGEDKAEEYTIGFNFYPRLGDYIGNNAKFSLDLSYLPDGSPVKAGNLGIQKGSGEQFMARVQFRFIL
ncbi:MAG: hypothetical protein ACK4PI_06135 [Tepidisphaerales bacterium]